MKRQPIHNDNYEEYFLLYVDNELNPAERKQVDAFVIEHPDLKIELQILLDTKLDMEDVSMAGRERLYRQSEPGLITHDNVEEFQILMLDGELAQDEIQALDQYHANHSDARRNFDWLKKAKLPEEQVVFPDKNLLYRSGQKTAPFIPIKWYRIAAAAAVLITAGLLWFSSQNDETGLESMDQIVQMGHSERDNNSKRSEALPKANQDAPESLNGNETAAGSNEERTVSPGENGSQETRVNQPENAVQASDQQVRVAQPKNELAAIQTNDRLAKTAQPKTPPKNAIAGNTRAANNGLIKNTEQNLVQAQVDRQNKKTGDYAAIEPDKKPKPVDVVDKVADEYLTTPNSMATTTGERNVKKNYASDALNNQISSDEEDIEPDTNQRKGLRGIVRKANRFYNKVTNPDNDKPMVKVANFEIGLSR
jgi:hypothetical protein